MNNKKRKRVSAGYYIREGFKSVFVHGFMSFAAVVIVVGCLLIVGSFSLLLVNVNAMITDLEQESEILAYVDDSLSGAEARSVGSRINLIPNVKQSVFVTNEEALSEFVERYDDPSIFNGLDSGVLRHRYKITLEDVSLMSETKREVEAVDGIAYVNAFTELSNGFMTVRMVLRIVSLTISAILLVISIFIISNTVKLATFNRREEIAIMKMVGATNSFVRWPFVIQGLILGIMGSVIAFAAEWGVYRMVAKAIVRADKISLISLVPFNSIAGYILAAFLAVGILVGAFGSSVTIRKYLRT